ARGSHTGRKGISPDLVAGRPMARLRSREKRGPDRSHPAGGGAASTVPPLGRSRDGFLGVFLVGRRPLAGRSPAPAGWSAVARRRPLLAGRSTLSADHRARPVRDLALRQPPPALLGRRQSLRSRYVEQDVAAGADHSPRVRLQRFLPEPG